MTDSPHRRFEFGPFCLDVAEQRLLRDRQPIPLTPKIFELLRVLVEHAGHLVEKERLIEHVWPGTFVEEASLSRGISVIRKTLGETESERYIETVPKRGYRFVHPVRIQDGAAATTRGRQWMLPAAAAVLAVVATAAFLYGGLRPNGTSGSPSLAAPSIHRQLTFSGKELAPAVSPDGRRIAYVSNGSPQRTVMVRELSGGEAVEIFRAPEAGWMRWSPDSSELMFGARGDGTDGLYVSTISPGSARKMIPSGPIVACWSPDGSTIAIALFVSKKIRFINRTGDVQRTISLSGTQDWIWDLDWSPVNGLLMFVADDEQRRPSIWTIRPDGRGQTRAITASSEILAARWAPAGDAIYYFARVGQTISLYKAFLPGSTAAHREPLQLISGLESDVGFGVSADGTKLVYARAAYHSNLWTLKPVGANGSRVLSAQLTHGTSVIERPRVSPDGRSILFNMGYESRSNLFSVSAGGGPPRQLTFLHGLSLGGVWSPDGREIAFASDEGGQRRVWVVNADGASPRALDTRDLSKSFELAWSPGDRVIYQQADNRNYSVVDPRTERQATLVKDGSVGWMSSPVPSPDGMKVAVAWNRYPARGVYVINRSDGSETLIHQPPPKSDAYPFPIGWSSDGRFIYAVDGKRAAYRGVTAPFEETMTGVQILKLPVDGGQPDTIMRVPFEEVGSITMFPDGLKFVCVVYSSRSDVWVVENFDLSSRTVLARR